MRGSLDEVVDLFELAQSAVFKLMASVRCNLLLLDGDVELMSRRILCLNSYEILGTPPYFETTK